MAGPGLKFSLDLNVTFFPLLNEAFQQWFFSVTLEEQEYICLKTLRIASFLGASIQKNQT
jgi:hypothetical protein